MFMDIKSPTPGKYISSRPVGLPLFYKGLLLFLSSSSIRWKIHSDPDIWCSLSLLKWSVPDKSGTYTFLRLLQWRGSMVAGIGLTQQRTAGSVRISAVTESLDTMDHLTPLPGLKCILPGVEL